MDKNYKTVLIRHVCPRLCKSFVQGPVTVGVEPPDLGVGGVGGLMRVDRFSRVLLTVEYL